MVANRFLPNEGDVAVGREELSHPDGLHFDTLVAARDLNGVLDGCVIDAGAGTREIDVAVGCVVIDGVTKTVAAQTVGPLDTGAAQGNPRIDLITINTSGTLVVTKGTIAAVPEIPLIPASSAVLGVVLIADGQTTIVDGDINDMEIDLSRQPFVMHRTTTTTGPANDITEVITFTYTIPGRALGISGGIRLIMFGQHLNAVGTNILTLKVKLGATTVFNSGSQSYIADTDPRTWKMIIDLLSDGSLTLQKMYAKYSATSPLATQFNMGIGSTEDQRISEGYATVSEDMSADRALVVTAQIPTNQNPLNSFKTELAYVERLPPS